MFSFSATVPRGIDCQRRSGGASGRAPGSLHRVQTRDQGQSRRNGEIRSGSQSLKVKSGAGIAARCARLNLFYPGTFHPRKLSAELDVNGHRRRTEGDDQPQ